MAEFLKGNHLNSKLDEILEKAENNIILISPFIKFHSRVRDILNTKKHNDKLKLTIIFGKNEGSIEKSFNKEDFEFVAAFPNVEIFYEPRLHAKYYGNESASILSSMNLYEYSQNNNIEFGIYCETTRIDNILRSNTLDKEAWNYFNSVIEGSEPMFQKDPVYESKRLGFGQKYVRSEVTLDKLSFKYGTDRGKNSTATDSKPRRETLKGYCIRTGKKIPFDLKMPLSKSAYQSWLNFENPDYPEKYCHFSGEPSNGQTSFSKPILNKNWKKAQNSIA